MTRSPAPRYGLILRGLCFALLIGLLVPSHALADQTTCPRPVAGSVVTPPPDLYAKDGVLTVHFNYFTAVDDEERTLFCFITDHGKESPTLHVDPGDKIVLRVTNMVPPVPGAPSEVVSAGADVCGNATMTPTSVNVHFHGTNTLPACHSDETIRTLINSGETFEYVIHIPKDEPPGLYWYHPHVHGTSSVAVDGGASGAIVVEGIEAIQPAVVGLPQRVLVLRDQPLSAGIPIITQSHPVPIPFWDASINYVPIVYPVDKPAILKMHAGSKEFWRVTNSSANTVMDIQLTYDHVQQPLEVVALDGVPTGSQDGKHVGSVVTMHDILLPPAGRAEFMVTAPTTAVKHAMFSTLAIDSGPLGDSLPFRPFATVELTDAPLGLPVTPKPKGKPNPQRFGGLDRVRPSLTRHLYFSETFGHAVGGEAAGPMTDGGAHSNGGLRVNFFITVKGQQPKLFDPNDPPAITTTQGAVEDWVIQNRAPEVHEFHIHQVHFLLLAVNGVPVPPEQRQFYDTYQVGYWDQTGPYPSIKVRMDFRGPTIGDFVYHCHILQHEDGGMMAKIRVLPKQK
ncbi:MAG: multicopper oxidase domain-containing protein [Alphaproteobacteria bacterium]|nr:multicopper oxidase domain-containing protein [Alphaproteobacteria bacterium]